jgi:hypothetical protein
MSLLFLKLSAGRLVSLGNGEWFSEIGFQPVVGDIFNVKNDIRKDDHDFLKPINHAKSPDQLKVYRRQFNSGTLYVYLENHL